MSFRSFAEMSAGYMFFTMTTLSACGNFDGALGAQLTLSGQISGWKHGGGHTLKASLPPSSDVIASAPIDGTGHFSIQLPDDTVIAQYLYAGQVFSYQFITAARCIGSGGVQTDPAMYSLASLALTAYLGSSTYGYDIVQAEATGPLSSKISYFYFDRDVTSTGEIDCTSTDGSNSPQVVEVYGKSGWNRVIGELTGAQNPQASKLYTGPLPDGAQWFSVSQ